MLNAKKVPYTGSNRVEQESLDPGTYPIRLVQVISMGLQKQREFKGEAKDPAYDLYLTYEFLDEFMKDEEGNEIKDKPRWLSERIPFHSLESDLAKSTKRYYALDPEGKFDGDWSKLAGTPGMLTITKSKPKEGGKVYNNVAGLSGMREKDAAKAPKLVNPPKVFDLDDPDMEVFQSLPQWLQDAIKENLEYEGSALEKAVQALPPSAKGGDTGGPKKATQKPSQEVSEDNDDEDEEW